MRRWGRRGSRQRMWAIAAVLAVLWWAWVNHPIALIVTTVLLAPTAVLAWRAWAAWRMRAGERTWLYRHYLADGTPLYYGITNAYHLRCGQHAEGSWWWPLVDPALSTTQEWPNRRAAERAETAAIRADCPPGNIRDNWRYRDQTPLRRMLQARAGAAYYYGRTA